MIDAYMLLAVVARDLSAADSIVERLSAESSFAPLDVVSLGRKSSGDVRFDREPRFGATRPRWSAAAGLAAALFPSVAADQPASRLAERAVLATVSGRVAAAIGRSGLQEFGELLDTAAAAVIAAAPAHQRASLVESVADESFISRTVQLDTAAIDIAVRIASGTTSSARS